MTNESLSIPRWFIRICSGVLALGVPWAGWVTLQLATISVEVEAHGMLRNRFESHIEQDIATLHHRVERVEDKLDRALQK